MELENQIERFFVLPNSSSRVQNFVRFIYLSQVVQSLCIGTQTRYYRTLKQSPGAYTYGALYWQLNDVWQAQSWSSLEYEGRWKLLHYTIKEAFEPVSVSIFGDIEEGPSSRVNITVVSDVVSEVQATLRIEAWAWNTSAMVYQNSSVLHIPALSANTLWHGPIGQLSNGHSRSEVAIRCVVSYGETRATSVLLPRSFLHLDARDDPQIAASGFRSCNTTGPESKPAVCFMLEAKYLAAFVVLSTPIAGVFSTNGMLMPPSETQSIEFVPSSVLENATSWLQSTLQVQAV